MGLVAPPKEISASASQAWGCRHILKRGLHFTPWSRGRFQAGCRDRSHCDSILASPQWNQTLVSQSQITHRFPPARGVRAHPAQARSPRKQYYTVRWSSRDGLPRVWSRHTSSQARSSGNRSSRKRDGPEDRYEDADVRVVGFGFSTGHELPAHTAPMPATMYFLQREGI